MTDEDLQDLIGRGDCMRLAEAVASLDETTRRRLAKTASRMLAEYQRNHRLFIMEQAPTPLLDLCRVRLGDLFQPNKYAADLAVLATASLSEARKATGNWSDFSTAAPVKVLSDRRPVWLDEWIEYKLDREQFGLSWELLWNLIRIGVCKKPRSDNFIRLMVRTLERARDPLELPALSERLTKDPGLLDEVWRLFEVESNAFFNEWEGSVSVGAHYESWSAALVRLSEQGHLDRGRLLDSCLRAFSRDFSNKMHTGLVRFHQRLKPTAEQMIARQASYIGLLHSRVTHVVTFALDVIGKIEKSREFDAEAFFRAAPAVFSLKPKKQANAVLTLAAELAGRRVEFIALAINLAVEAFAHASPEIQEQAIAFLESRMEHVRADQVKAIRVLLDEVCSSLRLRAEAILTSFEGPSVATTIERAGKSATARSDTTFADLVERSGRLRPPWRHLAGVDEALDCLRRGQVPPSLRWSDTEIPVLSGREAVPPIADVDELLDAVAHALETVDSADELERILDGVSRLCDQRPEGFDRRMKPLLKRLMTIPSRRSTGLPSQASIPLLFRELFLTWLGGRLAERLSFVVAGSSVHEFIELRIGELQRRVLQRRALPLLAFPTHTGGWIDPLALIRRLEIWSSHGIELPTCDLLQALLRLAPDSRQAALLEAAQLTGPEMSAVRWALGGDELPGSGDAHQAVWLAAGRARHPHGELAMLAHLVPQVSSPDAIRPAQYSWRPHQETLWKLCGAVNMTISVQPPQSDVRPEPRHLTAALHDLRRFAAPLRLGAPWWYQWLAMTWPLNLDSFFAAGVICLAQRVNSAPSVHEPSYVFLEALFGPDVPWSEMAYLALTLGLVSKDSNSSGAARDALIAGITDGRAEPSRLSGVLTELLPGGWLKLNRVASALGEVARASALCRWFVVRTLEEMLIAMRPLHRDSHHLLTLLVELLTELQIGPSPALCDELSSKATSPKIAKLSRALTSRGGGNTSPRVLEAAHLACQSRLDRAERWAGVDGSSR